MLNKIIETTRARGAEAGEAFMLESESNSVDFENNNLKSTNKIQLKGVAVRAIRNGCLGFASSSDLKDPERLANTAVEVARSGEHAELNLPTMMEFDCPKDMVDEKVENTSVRELVDTGHKFIDKVQKYDPEILASTTLQTAKARFSIANSEGLDASYEKTIFFAVFMGQIIIDTTVIYCYRQYAGTRKADDLEFLMDRALEDLGRAKQSATVESGKTTVIFTPRAMQALFEFLRSGVNGKNIEKGISPLRDKKCEEILDDRITVFENGALPGGLGSAPFDDEGVALKKKPIVEGGVLRNFITDLTTSAKLHDVSSGNGFRFNSFTGVQDYQSTPLPKASNWILESGDVPCADLIGSVKKGVLVDQMMGLFTSNFLAGDFSGNLSLGYRIKDGQICGRIKNAMVAGNMYNLLKDNLIDLSSETENVLGEGTTAIYPYVALKDVMVTV